MGDPHPLEPGHVGKEGDDVGRGEPGRHLVVGGGDAERADARRRWPAIRHSWRASSTLEVLPLVPVTATIVSGKGWKNLRGQPGEFAARLGGGEMGGALDLRLGPRHHRDRARGDRVGDEILAVEARARKAPNTVPGATLRWSMAKPVTGIAYSLPVSAPGASSVLRLVRTKGRTSARLTSRLSSGMTPSSGPVRLTILRDDRRGVPGGGVEAEGFGGGLGGVDHDQHHIARLVHRENAAKVETTALDV